MLKRLTILVNMMLMSIGVVSCSSGDLPTPMAPVVNAWNQPAAKQGPYIVQSGDTLYSVAWAYGIDYRSIIRNNHLQSPYQLKTGQTLYLVAPENSPKPASNMPQSGHGNKSKPSASAATADIKSSSKHVSQPPAVKVGSSGVWQWPVSGTVIQRYDANNALSRGIDIKTKPDSQVHAARAGEVVYAGHGIPGYGNLIIVKHGTEFLSAYAYNAKNLVHEGDKVKAGQVIATVQGTKAKPNVLHFEIRDRGQPVNPLQYLPSHTP